MPVSLWYATLNSPSDGVAGSNGTSMLILQGSAVCISVRVVLVYILMKNMEDSSCHLASIVLFVFLTMAILTGVRWHLNKLLTCIFLMATDAGYFLYTFGY